MTVTLTCAKWMGLRVKEMGPPKKIGAPFCKWEWRLGSQMHVLVQDKAAMLGD